MQSVLVVLADKCRQDRSNSNRMLSIWNADAIRKNANEKKNLLHFAF